MAAILLLFALGISENQILHDYLLTNRLSQAELQRQLAAISKISDAPDLLENIRAIWTVQPDYFHQAMTTMQKLSGNPQDYLRQHLHLTTAELDHLRDKYLFVEK